MKGPALEMAGLLLIAAILVCLPHTDAASVGEGSSRVYGGHKARTAQFPWQVYLHMDLKPGDYYCGGATISSVWVLTAGHCVEKWLPVELRFGSLLVTGPDAVIMTSTTFILHHKFLRNPPGATAFELENDIALVKIPMPLTWTATIAPVSLPRRSQRALSTGDVVTTSGFGADSKPGGDSAVETRPSALKFVTFELLFDHKCYEHHFMCTELHDKESTNFGDSGGGVVWQDPNGVPRLVGLVSDGLWTTDERGTATFGNVFTLVSDYLDWITEMTGIELEN